MNTRHPRLEYHAGSLVLHDADGLEMPPGVEMATDGRIGAMRCLAHHYRAVVRHFAKAGLSLADDARAYPDLPPQAVERPALFPHQREALEAWGRGKRGVVELPTGSGKTRLALEAIALVGRATLVVVPTLDLMAQWARSLEEGLGIRAGLIGGGSHEVAPLTVTTYASAFRQAAHLGNRFCLAVFDECHHLAGERHLGIAEMLIAPYRLGLSATVERPDERHHMMYQLVGPMVYRQGINALSGEYLADYRVETLHAELSPQELEAYNAARATYRAMVHNLGVELSRPGGWQRFVFAACQSAEGREALAAYYTQRRIAFSAARKFEILEELLTQHRDERVLVFTNDNATAYEIGRRLLLPVLTHQTPVAERKALLAAFADGSLPYLVSSRVLNEGVDVPSANVAVILSGTSSVREHVQRLGRILRHAPGKQALLYEVLSHMTGEEHVSRRRRQHDAYR